jgi:hypothetical protein
VEYRVKAGYLLNFTEFVEWPHSSFASPTSPINICTVRSDAFGGALEQTIAGEKAGGRPVSVQRISRGTPLRECQIAFNEGAEPSSRGTAVQTVGEGPGFLKAGGMIAFVIDNRRVRFDVNQMHAESTGVKISAKLLGVARSVVR